MIIVSRFTAEAIAEITPDEDIVSDNDESIEVNVIPNQLDLEEVERYVAHQYGNKEDAQKDIQESFSKIDMSSSKPVTILWES